MRFTLPGLHSVIYTFTPPVPGGAKKTFLKPETTVYFSETHSAE